MSNLRPPYQCVLGLIRCSASIVQQDTRKRPEQLKETKRPHTSQKDLNHAESPKIFWRA